MPVYKIAGIKVFMEPRYETTLERSEKYKIEGNSREDAEMIIEYPDAEISRLQKIFPHALMDACEYRAFSNVFKEMLIDYNGISIHSSAVVYDGRAYLFSAPSGTGKSTHTDLWLKHFGEDKAYILNDDKPAIRIIDGKSYAFGTPFSGKHDLSRDEMVPLQAVCMLNRGEENKIEKLEQDKAIYGILKQTKNPPSVDKMNKVFDVLDSMLREVSVFRLFCNISEEAVITAYEGMKP